MFSNNVITSLPARAAAGITPEPSPGLHEAMFDREARRCCARRDVYFAVDRVEVGAHGVGAEE